jgi:hypothetical protein
MQKTRSRPKAQLVDRADLSRKSLLNTSLAHPLGRWHREAERRGVLGARIGNSSSTLRARSTYEAERRTRLSASDPYEISPPSLAKYRTPQITGSRYQRNDQRATCIYEWIRPPPGSRTKCRDGRSISASSRTAIAESSPPERWFGLSEITQEDGVVWRCQRVEHERYPLGSAGGRSSTGRNRPTKMLLSEP